MNLLGITFCGSLFDGCSCFLGKKDKPMNNMQLETELLSLSDETLQVLPFAESFELKNLFPQNNHVEDWTHLVVGCDKRVIFFRDTMGFTAHGQVLNNHRFDDVLKGPYSRFFEVCMNMIMTGCGSSFLLLFKGTVYLATLFSYLNNSKNVIGGAIYIRKLNSIPEVTKDMQMFVQTRRSTEVVRKNQNISASNRKDDA